MSGWSLPELQQEVAVWMRATFPDNVLLDRRERGFRFCEEALELVQALGVTKAEASALVEYVFDRDAGAPEKEVGDAMITLAALSNAVGVPMDAAFVRGMRSNWNNRDRIRAKHESKPTRGPLPGEAAQALSSARRGAR